MELNLNGKKFLVGGATSGFGRAVSEALLKEGAHVVAVARSMEKLKEFKTQHGDSLRIFEGDLTNLNTLDKLASKIDYSSLYGVVVNAGGPPAKSFLETTIQDWDEAYNQIVRWKVKLTRDIVPHMMKRGNGRFLYIESVSVKQPIENLVLSNSLRMAVVGFVKSLSADLASSGITFNILAPGYHETQAIERLLNKASEVRGISRDEAKASIVKGIPAGFMGDTSDFASLACWLLSKNSRYINGQTISVDGGVVRGVFG